MIESIIKAIGMTNNTPTVVRYHDTYIVDDYSQKGSTHRGAVTANPLPEIEDPITISLQYLRDIILEVHRNVAALTNKVEYHNTKYFNAIRTLNIVKEKEDLEVSAAILDERFNDFIKIMSIIKN
jgi:hypothetical protein